MTGIPDGLLDLASQLVALSSFYPLKAGATHVDFDGDSYSTTAKTEITWRVATKWPDVPAAVKALLVTAKTNDSGSSGGEAYIILAPNNTAGSGVYFACSGVANDVPTRNCGVVPLSTDATTKLWYQIVATGTDTLDVVLEVWGYWV